MMRHWNRRLYVFCFNVDDISMIIYYQNSGAIKRRVTEKIISGEEIWDCYISTNVFWNTEWTRTLSIWSLIHYFFSLQQSWHTQDHQIKKKQPGTMRIDILASILFFEVIWISTHDPHFRVIHFFFFVSFSEILSHVELIYRPRVGTLRWKIDLLASKIWFAMWNAPIRRKFPLPFFF